MKANQNNQTVPPFGIKDKIGYMLGDFGNDFTFLFAQMYLMVFCTDVLGIGAGVVGVLLMTARIVDAFTDTAMGRICDIAKPTKDGRFRVWIKRMAVPMGHLHVLGARLSAHAPDRMGFRDLHPVGKLFLHSLQHSLRQHGIRDHQ